MPYLETSALDSSNVDEAFKKLILEIYLEGIKRNLKSSNIDKDDGTPYNRESIGDGRGIKLNETQNKDENGTSENKCSC